MDDFLAKPIQPRALQQVLLNHLPPARASAQRRAL
jgi:CheY-like chemotaxis protein